MPAASRGDPAAICNGKACLFGCAAQGIKDRNRRREAVVDHLTSWSPLTILSQQPEAGRCWVWFVISRPVPEATVREFAKECPHYVAKSFKAVGHACGEWGR